MAHMDIVIAVTLGAVAGHLARRVLATLKAPVRTGRGLCEAVCAVGWALVAARATTGDIPLWWLPVPAVMVWLALVLTATDVRHRLLPDVIVLPAYPVLAALLAVAAVAGPGAQPAVRAAVAGVMLLAVHAVVHLAAPGQLGAGDVKLAGLVGGVLGAVSWSALLVGPVIAAVVTALIAVTGRRRTVPHGPGLLVAALLVTIFPAAG